jgi:hypothetical protein
VAVNTPAAQDSPPPPVCFQFGRQVRLQLAPLATLRTPPLLGQVPACTPRMVRWNGMAAAVQGMRSHTSEVRVPSLHEVEAGVSVVVKPDSHDIWQLCPEASVSGQVPILALNALVTCCVTLHGFGVQVCKRS